MLILNGKAPMQKPAPYIKRISAYVIDYCLLTFCFAALPRAYLTDVLGAFSALSYSLSPSSLLLDSPLDGIIGIALVSVFLGIYNFLFEISPLAASPGKILTGLAVVGVEGYPAPLIRLAIRNCSRFFCVLSAYLGYGVALCTEKKQGVHDLLAQTVVIERRNFIGPSTIFAPLIALLLFGLLCFSVNPQLKNPAHVHAPADNSHLPTTDVTTLAATQKKSANPPLDFPALSIGTLYNQGHPIALRDFIIRRQRGKKNVHNNFDTRTHDQSFVRLEIAFFDSTLTDAQKLTSLQAFNLLRPAATNSADAEAVVVIALDAPTSDSQCTPDLFDAITVTINHRKINPEANSTANSHLRFEVDPKMVLANKKFSIACNKLQDGEAFSLALQVVNQGHLQTVPTTVNVNVTGNIRSRIRTKRILYRGGDDTLAAWDETSSTLELAFFSNKLSASERKDAFQSPSFQEAPVPPEAVAVFTLGQVDDFFVRDQVNTFTITFFSQKSGVLKFLENNPKLSVRFSKPRIPKKLAGRRRNGERLIGRLKGEKSILRGKILQNFEWSIPFNAQLLIRPSEK